MAGFRWLEGATLACLVYVVLVNSAVRALGGDPFWLSPRHLDSKTQALLSFGRHALGHAWRGADADPHDAVWQAARRHGFPARLALAVAKTESSLRAHCISATGAMGVMQLMPGTARELGVTDPFDPVQSAEGGVRYLVWLERLYAGDVRRAVAAYNAGPGSVPRRGPMRLPGETRAYVAKILGP